MRHTLRFLTYDNGNVLLEEHTLAYGLVSGYEHGAEELGVPPGSRVRMELLDDNGHLLDARTYFVPTTGGQFPTEPSPRSPRRPASTNDPPGISGGQAGSAGRSRQRYVSVGGTT